MTEAPPACFNCADRGTDIFYPNVESIVYADAVEWLFSPSLDWYVDACPYCAEEDDNRDRFGHPFGF